MKINIPVFLQQYWQKQPLVIRQAMPDFVSPITADELAGLSLEDDVESRIIIEDGKISWELRTGPFSEESFSQLPESKWTLLVQAVNHFSPDVQRLLSDFDFLPRWRLDDIMVSYAADGGSVGPHYDHYDVFLLQAEGKRRWKIGPEYNEHSSLLPHPSLKILSDFQTVEECVLEPGDMLYLPPGTGHHGVAEGECITISIGFRAPSHRDILMQFTDFVADRLAEHDRYSDPDLEYPKNPYFIDEIAIDRIQTVLQQYTKDRTLLHQWFGELMTQPKYCAPSDEAIADSWEELIKLVGDSGLELAQDARIACDATCFYANGITFTPETPEAWKLTQTLTRQRTLSSQELSTLKEKEAQQFLIKLLNVSVIQTCRLDRTK